MNIDSHISNIKWENQCNNTALENFIFSHDNYEIRDRVYHLCRTDYTQKPLFIMGASDSGKSFLALCIEKEVTARNKRYLREKSEKFVAHVLECIHNNTNISERYVNYDVVVFDEIEQIESYSIYEKLGELSLELYEAGKSILICGLTKPFGYPGLSDVIGSAYVLYPLSAYYKKEYIVRTLIGTGLNLTNADISRMAYHNMGIIKAELNVLLEKTKDERKNGKILLNPYQIMDMLGWEFYKD